MRYAFLALAVIVLLETPSFGDGEPKRVEESRGGSIEPTLLKTFSVPGRIDSFAFDSKGQTLVTVGWDTPANAAGEMDAWKSGKSRGDIHIWNVASGAEIAHFGDDVGGMFDVAFSPEDRTIMTAGRAPNSPRKGEVRIWDAKTHKTIRSLGGQTNWVICLACSPDGKLIASGGFDHTIRISEAATGKELKVLDLSKMIPRSVRFSRDGETLVAGYGKGTATLWEVETWEELKSFEAKGIYLMSADLSPDGKHLAAVGAEEKTPPGRNQGGQLFVWNLATSLEERVIPLDQLVSGVAFSPDGKYYAAAGFISKIWATGTGEEVADLKRGAATSADKIRFAPDGENLAIGALNNVTLWDVSGLDALGRAKK
jgi:WD40 repeat protein